MEINKLSKNEKTHLHDVDAHRSQCQSKDQIHDGQHHVNGMLKKLISKIKNISRIDIDFRDCFTKLF